MAGGRSDPCSIKAMAKTLQSDHATATISDGETHNGITAGGVNYLQVARAWRFSRLSRRGQPPAGCRESAKCKVLHMPTISREQPRGAPRCLDFELSQKRM